MKRLIPLALAAGAAIQGGRASRGARAKRMPDAQRKKWRKFDDAPYMPIKHTRMLGHDQDGREVHAHIDEIGNGYWLARVLWSPMNTRKLGPDREVFISAIGNGLDRGSMQYDHQTKHWPRNVEWGTVEKAKRATDAWARQQKFST